MVSFTGKVTIMSKHTIDRFTTLLANEGLYDDALALQELYDELEQQIFELIKHKSYLIKQINDLKRGTSV